MSMSTVRGIRAIRVLLRPLLAGLVAVILAACGSSGEPPGSVSPAGTSGQADWQVELEQLVQAAEQEGQLVVTVFNTNDRNAVLEFGKAYPQIEVEVQILTGRDFVVRVPAEMQSGIFSFDVFMSGSTTGATQLIPTGNVLEDTRSQLFLPEVIDDSQWVGGDFGDYWADDTTKRYVINHRVDAASNTFRVNRTVAPNVRTVDDWLQPEFRGRVCLEDPRTIGGGDTFFTVVMIFRGEDFVRRVLTETQPQITRDLRQLANDTVRGSCAITVGGSFTELEAQGVAGDVEQISTSFGAIPEALRDRVKIICCGEGKQKTVVENSVSGGPGGPALLRNAPHPNAAKLFLNWFLTREGQEAYLNAQSTVTTPEGTFAANCVGRVDTQHLCDPARRPDPQGAYIGFQWASNIALRDQARELAQDILGR
ncbi:MAG: hypothetical protein GEU73_14390 [Chloroflexi bacterium]|nr:hypothetical protein [Chloroflexota bacterium]